MHLYWILSHFSSTSHSLGAVTIVKLTKSDSLITHGNLTQTCNMNNQFILLCWFLEECWPETRELPRLPLLRCENGAIPDAVQSTSHPGDSVESPHSANTAAKLIIKQLKRYYFIWLYCLKCWEMWHIPIKPQNLQDKACSCFLSGWVAIKINYIYIF